MLVILRDYKHPRENFSWPHGRHWSASITITWFRGGTRWGSRREGRIFDRFDSSRDVFCLPLFFFLVSPLTRERTPTYGYQSLSIQQAGGGFSSDIRLGRYQGLVHVDDLTGLSLEVLLFVEIAVRRPFEGKAVHSTSGLLSLEHDDEQKGFVHLTFVHARHGRTSPCSCNQGVEENTSK